MRKLIVGVVVSATSIVGIGAAMPAAHAWDCCPCPPPPPPPTACDWRPGWGGAGAFHPPGVVAPGGGVGDQNHCHSGPPGLGYPKMP